MPLPEVIVIGAMKCATSAVHAYLDAHPDIAMSPVKELNFFNGPEVAPHDDPDRWWLTGQWHRGLDWYAAQFPAGVPLHGEASPAYTQPDAPEVPGRMARVLPAVRLVYLVRDPFDRALSQWRHHRRDGAEPRPAAEALLDPDSQYVARSRYLERLAGFLDRFDRDQLHVVVQERLLRGPAAEVPALHRHAGADPERAPAATRHRNVGGPGDPPDPALRAAFLDRVADDTAGLRDLLRDDLPEWDR